MRIKFGGQIGLISDALLLVPAAILACSLSIPGSTAPDAAQTQLAEAVAATLTAAAPQVTSEPPTLEVPSETATPTASIVPSASPTPEPTGTPTARPVPTAEVPQSDTFPDSSYVMAEEHLLGEYAVRTWKNQNSPSETLGFDQIVTIGQSGTELIVVEFFMSLNDLTGSDINADGLPEVVIETYTGGAHCCFATLVFTLGATADKILEARASNCGGQFSDLNGDGSLEFVTCDDIFAYVYCPYAASPLVSAVLEFQAGAGYRAANPRFAEIYQADLDRLRAQAESGLPGELGEWDGTNKCSVLPYILALYYSGDTTSAWSELERVYPAEDRETFRSEIEQTAQGSNLYAEP